MRTCSYDWPSDQIYLVKQFCYTHDQILNFEQLGLIVTCIALIFQFNAHVPDSKKEFSFESFNHL